MKKLFNQNDGATKGGPDKPEATNTQLTDNSLGRKSKRKCMKRADKLKLLGRFFSEVCFRNSELENFHSGVTPNSKTGDFSDVKVISPYGEIKWTSLSRLSDKEMRVLMLDVEKNVTEFLRNNFKDILPLFYESKLWEDYLERRYANGVSWDRENYHPDPAAQEPHVEPVKQQYLIHLPLSCRFFNVLRMEKINTLLELSECEEYQLLKFRGMGRKGIMECENLLMGNGLKFKHRQI